MYIRSLRPVDLTEMYLAFLNAFSDYPVPFRLSKDQFVRKFVEKLHIDFELSVGSYEGDALAGFIFSTVNYYEGKLTAYNGGTGVRPLFRGRGIVSQLYAYLLPVFKERGIEQCVLEVLATNHRAIGVYEKIGFKKNRYYHCFKLEGKPISPNLLWPEVYIEPVTKPEWSLYQDFNTFQPSFLDSTLMVRENLIHETVIEAKLQGKCIGYAVYQHHIGRISQLGVLPEMRRKGIGTKLLQHIYHTSNVKDLTIINITKEDTATRSFFASHGFADQLQQHEMILPL
jgi:ribosomal protein S18 acetylase RimI-like enzyme